MATERDLFQEAILENAISRKQKERKERREALHAKKAHAEQKAAVAAQKAKKRRRILLASILALIVAAVFVGRSVYRIWELKREKAQAEAHLAELQEKLERMENELTRITSDEYIEQQARTHLKMIFPGETLYIVVPSGSESRPAQP